MFMEQQQLMEFLQEFMVFSLPHPTSLLSAKTKSLAQTSVLETATVLLILAAVCQATRA
jgi:hypothetical protein